MKRMKQFTRMLALCFAMSAMALVVYMLLPPSESGRQAVEQLVGVRTFSLGPVGPAAEIPVSVDQFFAILASRHSSWLFRDLYERGTPEAKVYALCGLWLTSGGFDHYAIRLENEVESVATLGGCFGRERGPREITQAIREGAVDQLTSMHRNMKINR